MSASELIPLAHIGDSSALCYENAEEAKLGFSIHDGREYLGEG